MLWLALTRIYLICACGPLISLPERCSSARFPWGYSFYRFVFDVEVAIGEKVDDAADDHEVGTVIAVFPTVDGNFRYAVDTEGYGALQFFAEEKLVVHPC